MFTVKRYRVTSSSTLPTWEVQPPLGLLATKLEHVPHSVFLDHRVDPLPRRNIPLQNQKSRLIPSSAWAESDNDPVDQ